MSLSFTPFCEVFRPEYEKYWKKMGNPPTHVLIGKHEKELLDEETNNAWMYTIRDSEQTGKTTYNGVEVLTTPDRESVLYFFTNP